MPTLVNIFNLMELIKDIGEQGLLRKLQPFFPPGVVGDDGAVLDIDPNKKLVVTTDVLVDRVHFSDRTTTAFDVGWRGATANLSDLAAMGATPIGITVGLSLPGNISVSWVEELYRGLHGCLSLYQAPIVGGDITRSETISVAITALGQVLPDRIIRRNNARVNDAIVITGYHGLAKGGLELLLNPELGQNLTDSEKELLIQAHQKPNPRLDLIPLLEEVADEIAIAGMDSSDGLADSISQICHFSGVGAIIDLDNLPINPILKKVISPQRAEQWTLYGGEDFELVLYLPRPLAATLVNSLGTNAKIIGQTILEPKVMLNSQKRSNFQEISMPNSQFQHF